MSIASPAPPSTGNPATTASAIERVERYSVYGHSNLFYWWPVWLVGFILAALTYSEGHVMAVVPEGTTIEQAKTIPGEKGPRDVLVAPSGQPLPPQPRVNTEQQPQLRVSASNNYGVIFVATLLFVVFVTNIMVRGLASIVAIAVIIIAALTLAQLHLWDDFFRWLGGLDVRLNAGGYLVIAVPLFAVWCFAFFFYDRYSYISISQGQVTIRQAIGDGEVALDTSSLVLEKERNDFFRHWILGFGAGDLHVKSSGAAHLDFELNNVLMVASRLGRIQRLLREREVT